jgi:hypothetical protein
MSRGAALPVLLLGGGAAAALWLARRTRPASAATTTETSAAAGWLWPVPTLGDRRPVISDGWGSRRTRLDGTTRPHRGVDLMYPRRPGELATAYPPGTPNGTPRFFMPDGIPALAAAAGTIRVARRTSRGHTVVIAHASGWATFYTHLDKLSIEPGQPVAAGQPIGIIGGDPTDRRRLKHLHFKVWRHGTQASAVDPAPYLAAWQRAAIPTWQPPTVRNGRLVYRPVGKRGEPYPDWLRALKGESGVYVIRQDGEVLYVGQSSAGRLYETLTRHLQSWRRWKGFWKGQYAEGHDPGLTYDRDRVEVAVRVTSPDDALDEEARLIQRLRPRDNLLGQPELPELGEVPF